MSSISPVKCFISVGEASGDGLGAQLVSQLREEGAELEFCGILGPKLRQLGAAQLWPMESLNVMGLVDVLKKIAYIKMLELRVISLIERLGIRLAILVDFPGFHFRLAEQLKLRGLKVIQYVAPKLWAWGLHRMPRLRRDFDLVLGIFPFEQTFFKHHKIPFAFVGCPHLKLLAKVEHNRESFGLAPEDKVIACLPGSRMTEVKRILPVMLSLMTGLRKRLSKVKFILPLASNLDRKSIETLLEGENLTDLHLVEGRSLEVMKCADFAWVASGTATLECGLLATPMIVLYRMDKLSYFLAKKKVKSKWISLVNIIMRAEVVPEYIQNIDEDEVCKLSLELLVSNSPKREKMLIDLSKLREALEDKEHKCSVFDCLNPLLNSLNKSS